MLNVQDYQFNFNFFRCHLFHSLKARTLCSAVFWERCCQRPWCVTWRTTRPNVFLRYSWESSIRQRPSGAVRWGRNAAAVTYLTGSCLTANIWFVGILKTHHNWTFLFSPDAWWLRRSQPTSPTSAPGCRATRGLCTSTVPSLWSASLSWTTSSSATSTTSDTFVTPSASPTGPFEMPYVPHIPYVCRIYSQSL